MKGSLMEARSAFGITTSGRRGQGMEDLGYSDLRFVTRFENGHRTQVSAPSAAVPLSRRLHDARLGYDRFTEPGLTIEEASSSLRAR